MKAILSAAGLLLYAVYNLSELQRFGYALTTQQSRLQAYTDHAFEPAGDLKTTNRDRRGTPSHHDYVAAHARALNDAAARA